MKKTRQQIEVAEEQDDELVLAAIKYVGRKSLYRDSAVNTHGGYPGYGAFQRGVWDLAYLPSKKLSWWEDHADFEIAYDEQTIAEAIVEKNYLLSVAFGSNADPEIRDDVYDKLGLKPTLDTDELRAQIAEVAGADVEDVGSEFDPDKARREELSGVKRSLLVKLASETGFDGNPANSKTNDLVNHLTEQDEDRVDKKLNLIEKGEL